MGELPWFIWRRIIGYSVNYKQSWLCLVNKTWFKIGAGKFQTVDNATLVQSSNAYLKQAENLKLVLSEDLNWELLKECTNIKKVSITINELVTITDSIQEILRDLPWNSWYIEIINSVDSLPDNLLQSISVQLVKLRIYCGSPFLLDQIFDAILPNLTILELNFWLGILDFSLISRSAPQIENIQLDLYSLSSINSNNLELDFSKLKTLKITIQTQHNPLPNNSGFDFNKFLDLSFPNLKLFKLNVRFRNLMTNKIHLAMPLIEELDLSFSYVGFSGNFFSESSFNHLKKLIVNVDLYNSESNSIIFDLRKLPKLEELESNEPFKLIHSSLNRTNSLKKIDFTQAYLYPYTSICEYVLLLKKVAIDCLQLGNNLLPIINACTHLTEISLYRLERDFTELELPVSEFKATKLELSGEDCLTTNVLKWLSNQFKLVELTIHYDFGRTDFEPTGFPFLDKVKITSPESEEKANLEAYFRHRCRRFV